MTNLITLPAMCGLVKRLAACSKHHHFVIKMMMFREASGKNSSETTMCYNPPGNPRVGPGICQKTPLFQD